MAQMTIIEAARVLHPGVNISDNATTNDLLKAIFSFDEFAKIYNAVMPSIGEKPEAKRLTAKALEQGLTPKEIRQELIKMAMGAYFMAKLQALKDIAGIK